MAPATAIVWLFVLYLFGPPMLDGTIDFVHERQCKSAYQKLGLALDAPFAEVLVADHAYAQEHALLTTSLDTLYTVPNICRQTSWLAEARTGKRATNAIKGVVKWVVLSVVTYHLRVLLSSFENIVILIVVVIMIVLTCTHTGYCTKRGQKKRKKRSK
jgi:hypothetical protein